MYRKLQARQTPKGERQISKELSEKKKEKGTTNHNLKRCRPALSSSAVDTSVSSGALVLRSRVPFGFWHRCRHVKRTSLLRRARLALDSLLDSPLTGLIGSVNCLCFDWSFRWTSGWSLGWLPLARTLACLADWFDDHGWRQTEIFTYKTGWFVGWSLGWLVDCLGVMLALLQSFSDWVVGCVLSSLLQLVGSW